MNLADVFNDVQPGAPTYPHLASLWEEHGNFYGEDEFVKHRAAQEARLRRQVEILFSVFPDAEYLLKGTLDFGCGHGYFTHTYGGVGYDISKAAIEAAMRCFPGQWNFFTDLQLASEETTITQIVSFETFEHLEDPEATLQDLKSRFGDDIPIYIVVPNGRYDGYFGHRWMWTEHSLAKQLDMVRVVARQQWLFGWA